VVGIAGGDEAMKRQAETAVDVYRTDILPTLHGRQLFVRQELGLFITHYHTQPTAKELLVFIASRYPQNEFDLNTVRPRLTEMFEQGWVGHGAKRVCTITHKTVYTWEPTTPQPPLVEPIPQRLQF
jgi:hypothetical protein